MNRDGGGGITEGNIDWAPQYHVVKVTSERGAHLASKTQFLVG